MADITTNKSTLQNVFGFVDGDTRTVNLDNPKDTLTTAQVQEWADYAKDHNLLIGDKAGALLDGIKSSKKIDKLSTKLDLTND